GFDAGPEALVGDPRLALDADDVRLDRDPDVARETGVEADGRVGFAVEVVGDPAADDFAFAAGRSVEVADRFERVGLAPFLHADDRAGAERKRGHLRGRSQIRHFPSVYH